MKFLKVSIWLTIITTFVLINLGGFVHNTGSSLACPDWPLCYGELVPKMEGGILIEHSHRLLGALVGFFTICISFFSFKVFSSKSRIFKFSLVSLLLVIGQGLLGGLTVIYKLPSIVSTAHLGTSMIFLASLVYLLFLVEKSTRSKIIIEKEQAQLETITWNKGIVFHGILLCVFVYFQMLLGASMRHLGLGGVCGTGWENTFACLDLVSGSSVQTFFPTSSEAKLHIFHRYFAYVVAFYTFYFCYQVFSVFKKSLIDSPILKRIKFKALLIPIVIVAQIILGISSVGTNLGVLATTLHLGGAALLFSSVWKIFLELKEFRRAKTFVNEKYDFISDIFSMSKPRLSLLVIFTSGIGMYLSGSKVEFFQVVQNLVFITSVVAGACILNCAIEKDIDKKMKRTALRPLADGRVSMPLAWLLGSSLCLFGLTGLFLYTNNLTAILGLIATISYVVVYTPLKQLTPHAVFVGALPGALPPLMGFTAVTGELGITGIILFALLFVWQLPHFMAISLMYSKDYEQAGIKVFPNREGKPYTVKSIIGYSAVLLIVSVLPVVFSLTSSFIYLFVSLCLGITTIVLASKGLQIEKDAQLVRWSKKFFFSTIIYLPLQLGIMINQMS